MKLLLKKAKARPKKKSVHRRRRITLGVDITETQISLAIAGEVDARGTAGNSSEGRPCALGWPERPVW